MGCGGRAPAGPLVGARRGRRLGRRRRAPDRGAGGRLGDAGARPRGAGGAVLRAGRPGISWHDGATAEIRAGDAIAYRAGAGAHTLHALEPLDVLAFGPRHRDGSTRFPRLGLTMVGRRFVESVAGEPGGPLLQFVREAEIGAPELTEPPGRGRPTSSTSPTSSRAARALACRQHVARSRSCGGVGLDRPSARRGRAGQGGHAAALPLRLGGDLRRPRR